MMDPKSTFSCSALSYSYHYKVLKELTEASSAVCAHMKYITCLNSGRLMCGSGLVFIFVIFLGKGFDLKFKYLSNVDAFMSMLSLTNHFID